MDASNSTPMTEPAKRGSKDVWNDIEEFLATTDGISTRDAFRLGSLVREYGSTSAGEAIGPIMTSLLTAVTKPPKTPKQPWED